MKISRMIVGVFLAGLPLLAVAAEVAPTDLPVDAVTLQKLMKPCQKSDSTDRPRCESRQLSRLRLSKEQMEIVKNAMHIYDRIDLGGFHRQQAEQAKLQEKLSSQPKRPTYREAPEVAGQATPRRGYITDVRKARLECMLKPKGRQRALCFDQIGNEYRKLMRAERGSMKPIAD